MNSTLVNICKKLGVNAAEMRIIDSKGDLSMVLPAEGCSDAVARTPGVRGSVWRQLENGDVKPVYGTLGYADEYVADHITLRVNPSNNACSVVLTNYHTGSSVILDVGVRAITMCYEGLVYRITKDFAMNHRKLDARESTWGDAKYGALFTALGLPDASVLFSAGMPDDICHVFMAVHRTTITGTRQVFEGDAGYIVYLGAVDENNRRVPEKDYPFPHMSPETFPDVVTHNLGVICPVQLSIDEANYFLDNGFYGKLTTRDQRLKPGESIILHTLSGELIKVISSGFHWRNSLREGSTGIVNQYYKLVGVWDANELDGEKPGKKPSNPDATREWTKKTFAETFLPLDPGDVGTLRSFIERGKYYVYADELPCFTDEYLTRITTDVYERARVVYFNYLLSLPISSQREHVNMYGNYIADTDNLVAYIAMARKHAFHYIDPRDLVSVGSTKQPKEEVDELLKHAYHRKGCDNRIFDIRPALERLPNGKELVLLKEEHPRIASLIDAAETRAKRDKRRMRNVSDVMYEEMVLSNVKWLLAREWSNKRFQMAKQAYAWIKEPRKGVVVEATISKGTVVGLVEELM